MKIKLVHMNCFVGEVSTKEAFDPRPGDHITILAKDVSGQEEDFVYRIIRKNYCYHGVVFETLPQTIGQTTKTHDDHLVVYVDPANKHATEHLQKLLKETKAKKHPYTISCPDCKRDMLKMHEMKGIETWRCTNCQTDIIQAKEKGIIEVLPIPPGQV